MGWNTALRTIVLGQYLKIIGRRAHLPDTTQMPLPYGLVSGMPLGVVGMVGLTLLQVGVCYLIAKCFLGGKGTFIEVMRPLLLVWFVNCLVLIPSQRNLFYAGIVWMMVLMMVFEEVVGIRRLQAFCISAAVNFCVFAVQFEMLPVIHHL